MKNEKHVAQMNNKVSRVCSPTVARKYTQINSLCLPFLDFFEYTFTYAFVCHNPTIFCVASF
jgi:hypothetical protein